MFNTTLKTNTGQYSIVDLPDKCPFCHKSIIPSIITCHLNNKYLEVFMNCRNGECSKSFIAYYSQSGMSYYYIHETTIGNQDSRFFSKTILEISKTFVDIYNQSFVAEQYTLFEICGVGYRKSLEYLIKDYLIKRNPEKEDKIKKALLSVCINDYVEDSRIKSVSKRAAWLGNDETHYTRKWEGKTLDDLKNLINLTIHWIEMEKLTESFETDMPDSK